MPRSGHADLPLHYGRVPAWLHERMSRLGIAIVESIVKQRGTAEVLRRLSDPLWFQALGCVLGMDWHSSGITTSVMGSLKRALNPRARDLGLFICGGRGKHSRRTPEELVGYASRTGLNGDELVRCSRLSAKVDNTAIGDGFQIYLHCFVVSDTGDWAVIQQGLSDQQSMARRYHWHSPSIRSFVDEPHAAIVGSNRGTILNLVDHRAEQAQGSMVQLSREGPERVIREARSIVLPAHHKRLGAVLGVAHEAGTRDFPDLLLTRGLGPRTLQSLALITEVIYGAPYRFTDPARFSFAHGGKDGHPFPVPLAIYDESIRVLEEALSTARMGHYDRRRALERLHAAVEETERELEPRAHFDAAIDREGRDSWRYDGRTVADPPKGEHP